MDIHKLIQYVKAELALIDMEMSRLSCISGDNRQFLRLHKQRMEGVYFLNLLLELELKQKETEQRYELLYKLSRKNSPSEF